MSKLVIFYPDGTKSELERSKLVFADLYQIIGCRVVQRVACRYEGKAYDLWVNEEGGMTSDPVNPQLNQMVEAYFDRPCQQFVGIGVIFVKTKKGA